MTNPAPEQQPRPEQPHPKRPGKFVSNIAATGIAEAIEEIRKDVEAGNWSEVPFEGAAAAGLWMAKSLSAGTDPIGNALHSAVSTLCSALMEHIEPLKKTLDALAGDAVKITAFAQSFHRLGGTFSGVTTDWKALFHQLNSWEGDAAEAHAAAFWRQLRELDAGALAADTIGFTVHVVGELVARVRQWVRESIADFTAALVVRVPLWIAESGATLGVATPHVVASALTMVASYAGPIGEMLTKLVSSLQRLLPHLKRLGELMAALLTRHPARTTENRP